MSKYLTLSRIKFFKPNSAILGNVKNIHDLGFGKIRKFFAGLVIFAADDLELTRSCS